MSNRNPKPRRPDIRAVAAAALARADSVLAAWLPGGKQNGSEYVALNPKRSDAKPGSFSVNTITSAWSDFATADAGGDLVALVAYLDGVKQREAADRLAAFLGMTSDDASEPPASAKQKQPNKPQAEAVAPVPPDAPAPPGKHYRHGRPAAIWTYRDAAGAVLFHVARFDERDGAKQVLPLSLRSEADGLRWRWKGLPKPRPLYSLDKLAANPGAVVVVCEGEKDAAAAAALLPDCVAITSPNGSKSATGADWSPVKGRRIVIWPDADAPGKRYASDVRRQAGLAGAAAVGVLSLSSLAELKGEALPDGYGAADALADGLDAAALVQLIDTADQNATAPVATPPATANNNGAATVAPEKFPFFVVKAGAAGSNRRPGTYYVPTVKDRQTGELVEAGPEWICSPLTVEAVTRDEAGGDWGRLLAFVDRDGQTHQWAMPASMLARDGSELRELLYAAGLDITTHKNRRQHLAEFIAASEPGAFARCVNRTGWHGEAFVLPDTTIGTTGPEQLVFQTTGANDSKVAQAGTLEQWRDSVAAPCAGNPLLVLALSAAFAAQCLELVGLEGGGLHLRGASSSGKSTALALAASVYGPPAYRREWRQTDNALEGVAAQHSDQLLPLDEIGQLEPKHAAAVGYLMANGQGKTRSRRDGTIRAPAQWRLLFLSCGEVGLSDLVTESGGRARAGMEVRITDLPADAGQGLGIFSSVPDGTAPGAFADQLRRAAAENYGSAFPAWLAVLTKHKAALTSTLREATDNLAADMIGSDAAGQVRRVAQRFALIGVAGQTATHAGLTGWQEGEAVAAARQCFNAWLSARGGAGEAEPRAMVRQVQAFIETHSEGRFSWEERGDDDRAPRTLLRAGWRKDTGEGAEFWVLPECWRREVCAGFDAVAVARVMAERGLLMPPNGKGLTRREHVRGTGKVRVYRLLPGLLNHDA